MSSESEALGIAPPLYPFESRFFENAGHRQHFLDQGQGPLLLMVHGNPTWSFYYRRLVLGLRDSFRCVVPDHIGCGLSAKPRDAEYPYRFERRVDDLERLVDSLGETRPMTLVAHDWGGAVAWNLANQFPSRIKRLAIINSPHPGTFLRELKSNPRQQAAQVLGLAE